MTLRDFNNDAPFPADPRALHNEPLGNGAGLENFHTTQPEDIEPNNMPKIVGAVAVALMLGAAGVALYASSGSHPATVATASNTQTAPLPPPPAPAPAAATPDSSTPATPPAADNTPATAAPMKEASIPKTQKTHRTASIESKSMDTGSKGASATPGSAAADRMAADTNQSTVQPQQQQAVAAPTAPTPSPSDVASNNTQSGVAVSPNATTASDIPAPAQQQATPQASAPAPAQQQPSGADQSAGQVNQ